MIHIVICDNKLNELKKIVDGERTMLIRGNNSRRIPHSRIFVNDEIYFLEKGENTAYYHAVVKDAENYSKLTSMEIDEIFEKNKKEFNLSEKEIEKWKKKCLCVIDFYNLEKIDGIDIPHYTALEDWIMVNSLEDLNNR